MKKHSNLLKYVAFAVSLFALAASTVYAGGGEYHPMNFSFGQIINGKNFNIEMQVNDLNNGGYIVGEDFEIIAHHDLPGSGCNTTQRTSDANGIIKGNCYSDGTGRFVFEVQPVTKRNIQSGSTWEVTFASGTTAPAANGFPTQGSQNSEGTQAVIVTNPPKVSLNTPFTIEVKAKRNGQIQNDTSLIQSVRWTVLKGSLSGTGSPDPNNCDSSGACKNRIINAMIDDKSTTVMADVTLSSGENVKTGATALMQGSTVAPATNSKPSVVPVKAAASPTPKPAASASPMVSPGPSLNPNPTPAPSPTPDASAESTKEVKLSIFARIKNWFVGLWSHN